MTATHTDTDPAAQDAAGVDQLTRAQKALLALSGDVARQLAEQHGVCVRPLAKRRIDLGSGRVDVVPVPCDARRDDVCRPCAEKNRRIRQVQCRQGWHLENEPIPQRPAATAEQLQLLDIRAGLHAAYQKARADGDDAECQQIRDSVAVVDQELRRAEVTGRLEPLDPPIRPTRKRSTRRRQDMPNLPRRPVEKRTLGRGVRRQVPALHLPDPHPRFLRPGGRGRGCARPGDLRLPARRPGRDPLPEDPRSVLAEHPAMRRVGRAVLRHHRTATARRPALPRRDPRNHPARRAARHRLATDHGVFWPAHDEILCTGDNPPRWDSRAKGFVDPDTREPLPTWDQATDPDTLTAPTHVVRLGAQVHVKGILGGTEEAGWHIGYLTKYLTKDVARAAGLGEDATERQREHHRRLVAELRITPCSPRCGVWLLYGVQPKGARLGTVPGQCKGKAHKAEHLGIAGRRVLVSRKWSGRTLADHRAERADFVRQLLKHSGVRPGYSVDDGPFEWESTKAGDPDVPTRPALLLHAISERQRWKADYDAAVALAGEPPDALSATTEEAV